MRLIPRVMRSLFLGFVILSCATENSVGPKLVGEPGASVLAPAALPLVRISEFHYDNTGTDANEKIEITGPAGTDLTGWKILLYNGNGGGTYEPTRTLAGLIPATCGTRGVVVESYPSNGIQNGEPDGIALVDRTGNVIEFLSYEGAFVATNGAALGLTSKDIGVREAGTEALGQSLQRYESGNWTGPKANSFLVCNTEDETPAASVTVSPTIQSLAPGGTQQFVAKAFDAGAHLLPGVSFTWSSSDPAIAKVDVNGLVTSVKPGDVDIAAIAPNGMSAVAKVHVEGAEPPPPSGLPETRFVELHYDNVGSDINEAIEIEGPAAFALDGWSVVLYNGTGGAVYSTRALTGTIPDMCNGRGVVALRYQSDGIQNGPDGFALVDAAGKVVEFFSYEGKFTATDGPAVGLASTMMATDAGAAVSESGAPNGQSLRRASGGGWKPDSAGISIGACNSGIGPPAPSYQNILFTGRTADDIPLPVGFQDQIFGTVLNELGDTVKTAISWSSESDPVASIDARGVITALSPGTAAFRATTAQGFTRVLLLPTQIATPSTTARYGNNAEFGEPSDGDASDDFIIRRPQYTLSYNRNRGTPNWVSYDLDASHIGSLDRCDCFTFDPDLPTDYPRYNTADYTGVAAINGYGIDRGHLARSFDRTTGSLDNANTFYFSNIIPQASDLNQGPWAVLEDSLGKLATNSNKEVYIVAGVAGEKGTVKNEGKITIPAKVWKVAVIMPRDQGLANIHGYRDLDVIAVIMPNDAGVKGVSWPAYKTTVDAIEALSGYDLLAELPEPLEAVIESGDHPPTAVLDGPLAGLEGATLHFDATKSSDPDAGDVLSYRWDFGDGTTGTEVKPAHAYADNGSYPVTLTVKDAVGAEDSQTGTVTITNVAPSVKSLTASNALSGQTVFAIASFEDLGKNDRPWTYVFDWGTGNTSDGSTSDQNMAVGSSRSFFAAGTYTVSFRVTDKDGASSTIRSASFNVQRIPTTLVVNPERINLRGQGNGQIMVTVLGTSLISTASIDLKSVRIGAIGIDVNGSNNPKSSLQDVDNDGNTDLVLHFDRSALVSAGILTIGTTELVLRANLTDGPQIEARGPVNVGAKDSFEVK